MLSETSMANAALTTTDREILELGLNALLRERSIAYEIAAKVAVERGLAKPNVHDFGLPDSLRLSRAIRPVPPGQQSTGSGFLDTLSPVGGQLHQPFPMGFQG